MKSGASRPVSHINSRFRWDSRSRRRLKTIADFRHDNGKGIRNVCRRFVELCRELKLFSQAVVAIDGSKFNAVNSRERNYSEGKIARREREC